MTTHYGAASQSNILIFRFLRYLRTTTDDNTGRVFLLSTVWAEMRKSTSYKVDISVNADGVVQEAQCECGAGQGPSAHCKHVAVVLYGTSCFYKEGTVTTELTCTQVINLKTAEFFNIQVGESWDAGDLGHPLYLNCYCFNNYHVVLF